MTATENGSPPLARRALPRRDPEPDWILEQRRIVGSRVRDQRLLADLTQEDLRDASGVERLTIQRIESGATDARLSWLLRIAGAMGIHVRDLLGE
ncbi:helix-turn-helix transcriptional regulator [Streptomyces sp. NBC_01220]|uniref:helix-turn-helix transcriptional regulator n=1 Tax=Streptomyces sp. NBC_01220 TaxID=2903781 RepID=UPI00352CEBE5|nr:helix-turn-helix transcriptional regulator [Streptomyces sp. NBC_01220]